MRTLILIGYALSVCVAAVLFTACGGSQELFGKSATDQSVTTDQNGYNLTAASPSVSALSLKGETFDATGMNITRQCKMISGGSFIDFQAKGKAAGPLVGTFSATGTALVKFPFAGLSEKFEIVSGSSHIRGSTVNTNHVVSFSCSRLTFNIKANYRLRHMPQGHVWTHAILNKYSFHQVFH